jgi:hypothetical protein
VDYSTAIDQGWVFRGHTDATWVLMPQTFRAEGNFGAAWPFPIKDPLGQLNKEADLLISFAKECDLVGLVLPLPSTFYETMTQWGNEIRLRFSDSNQKVETRYFWESSYHEALAYAQHYGLPTRLLDCTKNPLNAALFAASERAEVAKAGLSADLCVWGINLRLLKEGSLFTYSTPARREYRPGIPWPRYKTIRMPWARNSFLRQQEGLFIIDCGAEYLRLMGLADYQGIEAVVAASRRAWGEPVLMKFVMAADADSVAELMCLLQQRNVTLAKLMPSLHQVIRTMKYASRLGFANW